MRTYIDHFKTTPAWLQMAATVEDSPWHREASTAVHTDMVLGQYLTRFAAKHTESQQRIALAALLFHDVGKPAAEETKDKKDGTGSYRTYAGHEQLSAVAFTEQWLTDNRLRSLLALEEARAVRWIIEHHLPYALKDDGKRRALRTALLKLGHDYEEVFYACLRSDAAGRISDDHVTKLVAVERWIEDFRALTPLPDPVVTRDATMYLLVGPSGSGKSTFMKNIWQTGDQVISDDEVRLQIGREMLDYQHDDRKAFYDVAWQHCADNPKEFDERCAQQLKDAIRDVGHGRAIFVDNTNLSKKRRARFVAEARKWKMRVVAVEFWTPFDVLVGRQKTRLDKDVPVSSVRKQLEAQTCTLEGSEVDEVILKPWQLSD